MKRSVYVNLYRGVCGEREKQIFIYPTVYKIKIHNDFYEKDKIVNFLQKV